jgi:hypothetical protein
MRREAKLFEWWMIPLMMIVAGIVFVALSFVA